ncbi:MAG: SDR family oxidoreductase [Actinobacteria bacterium]|nr:MAG: SDR family oxidoreductase [Actinomycetota bacterium]
MGSPLVGRTALVTGSDRGIGRAIAERLARDGALVAVHYATSPDAAREVVAGIEAAGGRAFPVGADFTVPGDADRLASEVLAGMRRSDRGERVDILVNNAAVLAGVAFDEVTPELFDQLMAVNAKAPLFLLRRLLPAIPTGGRVVNVSTGLTRFANPAELVHAMSKAALEMLTLHLARPLAERGITVNTVAPGVTDNGGRQYDDPALRAALGRLSVFGRIAEAAEIADVVAFLAAPDSRWITGTWLDATGGTLLGSLG